VNQPISAITAIRDLIVVFLAAWGLVAILTPVLPKQHKVYCELPYYVSSKEVHVISGMCELKEAWI
jgi:hypothetical protein